MSGVALAGPALAGAIRLATPSPAPGDELDPYDITPGLLGFVVTFAVVIAVILLLVNMTARLRRLSRSDEVEQGGGVPYADPHDSGDHGSSAGHLSGGTHGQDAGGGHGYDGGGHSGDGGDGGGGQ